MHMLVSMYYCIYMFSYGPYGPEIKHYYYYYYYTNYFCGYFLESVSFDWRQAFAGISLALLLASPPRSRDRIDDDHMTAVGGRILCRVKAYIWEFQFVSKCMNTL